MQTVKGTLKTGLKIGDEIHTDFELREPTAQDLFDAELMAPPDRVITFRTALVCKQLIRIGTYEGPFTLALLGKLSTPDLDRLHKAQREVEQLGEAQ